MQDIIVTGATGFIGRRLIRELVKLFPTERILCLIRDHTDELENSGRKILKQLNLNTKIIDLVTGKGLDDLPQNPQYIFHLAACTESGEKDQRCNDKGTENLLNAFQGLNNKTKFIFTSTTAVYSGRKNPETPVNEYTEAFPANEYGRTKLSAEKLLEEYSAKTGMKVLIFRLATVWGEGSRKNGLFYKLNTLINNNSILPRLNWKAKTSLINGDDTVRIIIYITLNTDKNIFSRYILSYESITLSEIAEVLYRRNKSEYRPVVLPDLFWKISGMTAMKFHYSEKIMPDKIYNILWRSNLILNSVLDCEPELYSIKFPEMKNEMKNEMKIEMKSFLDS